MFDLLLRFSFLVAFPTDNKFALFNLAQSLLLLIKQNKANNWNWLKILSYLEDFPGNKSSNTLCRLLNILNENWLWVHSWS